MRYLMSLFVIIALWGCGQTKNQTKNQIQTFEKKVYFKNLSNGDTVYNPISVEMGVKGMKIHPAGELKAGTGHHHIIINKGFVNYGDIIPMDETHLHYGKGDTVANLSLPTGEHTLTLQFANGLHMSYGEQFSNTISIYVK